MTITASATTVVDYPPETATTGAALRQLITTASPACSDVGTAR